jgi:Domain of unknown function (DUF6457)
MTSWIDELALTFDEEPLSSAETGQLLRVARDVAHRVERKETPLAAFLLGMRVARGTADGGPRAAALAEAVASIDAMLPAEPDAS